MIDSEVTGSGISADERSSDMEYLTLEDLGKVLDELAKERSMSAISIFLLI